MGQGSILTIIQVTKRQLSQSRQIRFCKFFSRQSSMAIVKYKDGVLV